MMKCIVCEMDSQQVPLLKLEYRGQEYHVCPGHLPVLIHKPHQLVEKMPGLEEYIQAMDS